MIKLETMCDLTLDTTLVFRETTFGLVSFEKRTSGDCPWGVRIWLDNDLKSKPISFWGADPDAMHAIVSYYEGELS